MHHEEAASQSGAVSSCVNREEVVRHMIGMDPRTHPRGAPPDFTLPRPNPNPDRMTDALWWLVCMRERLEPTKSDNGGTFANKPGYHNAGENLPDHGVGDPRTDHSIRRPDDRTGPWWQQFTGAHDWTFRDAQSGNFVTIDRYTSRLVNAMRDPDDLRPDDVYAYTLGQMDGDTVVEGYNEYTNMSETSADKTHNWHRHDSFRRKIIGLFWKMWQALTIDMGWTYDEWLRSTQEGDDLVTTQTEFNKLMDEWVISRTDAGATAAPIPNVRSRLRTIVWQYDGGGIPDDMSTLNVVNETLLKVREIKTDLGMSPAGAAAMIEAITNGVVLKLEEIGLGTLSKSDVEDAVRSVLKNGVDAPSAPAG